MKNLLLLLSLTFFMACTCDKKECAGPIVPCDSTTTVTTDSTKNCCGEAVKKDCCKDSAKTKDCCKETKAEEKCCEKSKTEAIDQSKIDKANEAYAAMIAVMNAGGNNYDKIQTCRADYQAVKSKLSTKEAELHIAYLKAEKQKLIDAQNK